MPRNPSLRRTAIEIDPQATDHHAEHDFAHSEGASPKARPLVVQAAWSRPSGRRCRHALAQLGLDLRQAAAALQDPLDVHHEAPEQQQALLARRFPLYAGLLDHLETNIPGVFAAGDVRHGSVKRFASAVGEGAMAVTFVHRYLMRG
jgi:hypothetical protein